jgi:hypothetical protein
MKTSTSLIGALSLSGNSRKTAAVSSVPPEDARDFLPVWRRAATAFALLAAATLLCAQEPRISPHVKAEIELKGQSITINYGSPRIRGRQIMGKLVPYGQVWRTGADEATSLKTTAELEIGGIKVPAGSYTIYTLPSEGAWKLIINKQTGQWGTEYDQSQDLARVDLSKTSLPNPLEEFTIQFQKTSADAATLVLEWETTRLSVPVRVR